MHFKGRERERERERENWQRAVGALSYVSCSTKGSNFEAKQSKEKRVIKSDVWVLLNINRIIWSKREAPVAIVINKSFNGCFNPVLRRDWNRDL